MDDIECKDCIHYNFISKCKDCCHAYSSKFEKKSDMIYVAMHIDGRMGGTIYRDESLEKTLNKDWFFVPYKQMKE